MHRFHPFEAKGCLPKDTENVQPILDNISCPLLIPRLIYFANFLRKGQWLNQHTIY